MSFGPFGFNDEDVLVQLKALWKDFEIQVSPFSQVLNIPGPLYRQFDSITLQYIAFRFMEHIQESVVYVIDGNGCDRAYLGPPRTFVVSGGSVIRGPGMELYWIRKNIPEPMTVTVVCPPLPPKHIKIPRPPNAYILYRKERHHLVKAANPGITNNEISQILGKAWNKEDPDVRALYQEQAFQVKQALLKKHPDYQYRPRRPSEKRRRRRSSPKEPLRAITDKEANDASDSASPGDSQCESKDSN